MELKNHIRSWEPDGLLPSGNLTWLLNMIIEIVIFFPIKIVIFHSYVKLRAGLRVCPERNELRLKEANFTAQAQCFMTLVNLWVTMFHVKFSEKSVGKVNPLRTSCISAFSVFHFFGLI